MSSEALDVCFENNLLGESFLYLHDYIYIKTIFDKIVTTLIDPGINDQDKFQYSLLNL